jgi:hypothetical protein
VRRDGDWWVVNPRTIAKDQSKEVPRMKTAKHIQKHLSGVSGFSRSLGPTRIALRRQLWIWPVVAALLLGGVGWLVHRSVENAMRENLAGELTTILNADVEALRQWTKDQTGIARALARAPLMQPAFKELRAIAARQDGHMPASYSWNSLYETLKPATRNHHEGAMFT